jgi:acyl carrier protein
VFFFSQSCRTVSRVNMEGGIMTDREAIRNSLTELVEADTGEKPPRLDDDLSLREGLGLDSVDVISIITQVERKFRVRLSQPELESLVTVGDVVNLLQAKLANPEPNVA